MPENKIYARVYLDREIWSELKAEAVRQQKDVSEYVGEILEENMGDPG